VKIGSQVWIGENLNYESANVSVCYNNSETNCATYGRLYDWSTAMLACPFGWRLPSNADWDALTDYVQNNKGCSSCDAKHLKAIIGWDNDGNGTDAFGFAALPGGWGYSVGNFGNVGTDGNWWCSSEYDTIRAYYRFIGSANEVVDYNVNDHNKNHLFSVRCIKDN